MEDDIAAKARNMSPLRQKFYYPMIKTLDEGWS